MTLMPWSQTRSLFCLVLLLDSSAARVVCAFQGQNHKHAHKQSASCMQYGICHTWRVIFRLWNRNTPGWFRLHAASHLHTHTQRQYKSCRQVEVSVCVCVFGNARSPGLYSVLYCLHTLHHNQTSHKPGTLGRASTLFDTLRRFFSFHSKFWCSSRMLYRLFAMWLTFPSQ